MSQSRSQTPRSERFFVRNVATGDQFSFVEFLTMGRTTGDVILSGNKRASARHCKLYAADGRVFIRDLKSSNGVIVNGEKIKSGDTVEIFEATTFQVGDQTFLLTQHAGGLTKPPKSQLLEFQPDSEDYMGVALFFILNVVVFFGLVFLKKLSLMDASAQQLIQSGGNVYLITADSQWWRLLTATFVHADIEHLASNMLALIFVGPRLVKLIGLRKFSLIYFGSGILASVASFAFLPPTVVTVGASGAIFGIIGALFLRQLLGDFDIKSAGPLVQLSSAQFIISHIGFGTPGVDIAAHIGGLFAGIILAFLITYKNEYEDPKREWMPLVGAFLFAAICCTVLVKRSDAPQNRMIGLYGAFELDSQVSQLSQDYVRYCKQVQTTNNVEAFQKEIRTRFLPDLEKAKNKLAQIRPKTSFQKDYVYLVNQKAEILWRVGTYTDAFLNGKVQADQKYFTVMKQRIEHVVSELQNMTDGRLYSISDLEGPLPEPAPDRPKPVELVAETPATPAPISDRKVAAMDPTALCQQSLRRYSKVPPSILAGCQFANEYSAQALNFYTLIYTRGMNRSIFDLLMQVQSQPQFNCVTNLAKRFSKRITHKLIRQSCFQ